MGSPALNLPSFDSQEEVRTQRLRLAEPRRNRTTAMPRVAFCPTLLSMAPSAQPGGTGDPGMISLRFREETATWHTTLRIAASGNPDSAAR